MNYAIATAQSTSAFFLGAFHLQHYTRLAAVAAGVFWLFPKYFITFHSISLAVFFGPKTGLHNAGLFYEFNIVLHENSYNAEEFS